MCSKHVCNDCALRDDCRPYDAGDFKPMACPVCGGTAITSYGCLDCGTLWNEV